MRPQTTSDRIYLDSGMFGGCAGVNQFARLLVKSNTREVIARRSPLAHGLAPDDDEVKSNLSGELLVETSASRFFRSPAKDGDFLQMAYGGNAGGYGDPIKRDPALAKNDLEPGLLPLERCRRVYGIEAHYDEKAEEWVIDEEKTAAMRTQIRQERLAKGVPVSEWWRGRRQDILAGNLPSLLKTAYKGSLDKGEQWPAEFRAFWDVPSDFTFEEARQ